MSERIAADAPYIEALLKNFTEPLPESFDWREKNVLDKSKQQGQCGSCWVFAFMGKFEHAGSNEYQRAKDVVLFKGFEKYL